MEGVEGDLDTVGVELAAGSFLVSGQSFLLHHLPCLQTLWLEKYEFDQNEEIINLISKQYINQHDI